MTFGERLYILRKEKSLSQEQLADQMEVSRQSIFRWENGSAEPDLAKLRRLAGLFEVSIDTLIGEKAAEASEPALKDLPVRKAIGWFLIVLAGIAVFFDLMVSYGFYMDYYLLCVFPPLLCGWICLVLKKDRLLFSCWAIYLCFRAYFQCFFGLHWRFLLLLFSEERIRDPFGFACAGVILLITALMIFWTLWSFRKKPIANRKRHFWKTVLPIALCVGLRAVAVWIKTYWLRDQILEITRNHGDIYLAIEFIYDGLMLGLLTLFAVQIARRIFYK